MFKSLPNLKKKILDRSHDEFKLPSLLYIDKTPQRSNPNNSSEHLKQLSSQTSPNCQLLIIDRSFVLYDTSNSNTSTLQHLECSPVFFQTSPRILKSCFDTRNYPLIPLIRFLQPDPGQALRWSIRHQLWSTRGDRVDRKSGVVAYEEDPRAGLCVVHGVASTSRQRKRVR